MKLFHQKKMNMCCRISLKFHRFSRSLKAFVACQRNSNSTFLCAIVTKTETGSIICYSGTWRARLMNRILLSRVCITYCLCMNRKWSLNVYQYAKKVSIVMLNNSTIINKTNSHLSPQIIKHIKDHDIY